MDVLPTITGRLDTPGACRLVLVPAVMELLGRANWWLPSWLARLLPAGRAGTVSENEPAAYPAQVR